MPRLLLVEDSPTQAQELSYILETADLEVERAPDAEQGWQSLQDRPFDLVLSDLLLPGVSGFQFCRRIKDDPDLQHLPVVLVTRWADPANVLRGLEAGADGFITKGREPEEILRRVQQALERSRCPGHAARRERTTVAFLTQQYQVWADRELLLGILLDAFEDVVHLDQRRQEELHYRKQAEEEVRKLNAELEQRVAERTEQLAQTNRQLRQRQEENETFVYSVSHDLRSPLVNLMGFGKELVLACQELHDLWRGAEVPESIRQRGLALVDRGFVEPVGFIQTAVTRLSGIIDSLLRLSRAGQVVYQWQPVDVQTIVERILRAMSGTLAERGATVSVRNLPPAWGDPTAVEQVLANLIGNALNYLDPSRPGRIEVGSREPPGAGEPAAASPGRTYYVKDNGLGIPVAYQSKLFHAFQRLHPRAAPGEGMGLAIVRRIVERHGGTVGVESTPGAGTTFWFTLPAGPEKKG